MRKDFSQHVGFSITLVMIGLIATTIGCEGSTEQQRVGLAINAHMLGRGRPSRSRGPARSQMLSGGPCHLMMEVNVLQLQEALSSGELTSRQLVDCYLARIDAFDQNGPALNAISGINPHAREDADALDAERSIHGARGP